jgi:8-oxo-dGTP pyrophosphatase MutT (NUDIX family)
MVDCLRREVKEETGLDVLSVGLPCAAVDVIEHEEGKKEKEKSNDTLAFHYCVIDFVAFAQGVPTPGDDASDARWVRADKVADYVETHEGVQEAIDNALQMIDKGMVAWQPL